MLSYLVSSPKINLNLTHKLYWPNHAARYLVYFRLILYSLQAATETGAPSPGLWQFCLGPPRCSSPGRIRKHTARFVTGNYNYETGSMTGILGQLKWESLKKRRKDNRLILLYKGLKGKASVPTNDLIPKTRHCRNQHSMAFQTPIANTDVYKGSFFPQTIRDWNALPDSLISSAEDAEDCVAKFTFLMTARD